MNVIYPITGTTIKSIEKLNHWMYRGISNNMLKYNNDSSNVLRTVDALGSWIYDDYIDVNYQFNLGLNNIDFTTIDRFNKFIYSNINSVSFDAISDTLNFDHALIGYSIYTNKMYSLKNVNKLSDFIRHSIPCDSFLDSKSPLKYPVSYASTILEPNYEYSFLTNINNTKITIQIATDYSASNVLIQGITPYLTIKGWNEFNEYVVEDINIFYRFNIISNITYSKLDSITCFGMNIPIEIFVLTYLKEDVILWDETFVDREEFDEYTSWASINTDTKELIFSTTINDGSYPPKLDIVDRYRLQLWSNETILDYLFDKSNQMLSILAVDGTGNLSLYKYPLVVPYSRENFKLLRNTDEQYVKVSYKRDGLLRKFSIYVFPTEKVNNLDSLTITVKRLFDTTASTDWLAETSYHKGDVVLYDYKYYLCVTSNADINWTPSKWKCQSIIIAENVLLDLYAYNIETNLLELSFDDLFVGNDECIIGFQTSGNKTSYAEILLQDPTIKYEFRKTLNELFTYSVPDQVAVGAMLTPIVNGDIILVDNMLGYNVGDTEPYSTGNEYQLYTISSNNSSYIRGWKLIDLYNTFFVDGDTKTIITSDTITHIVDDSLALQFVDTPSVEQPPSNGTELSRECVGFDLVGTYADGLGGSYTGIIESNSETCGYIPPVTEIWYDVTSPIYYDYVSGSMGPIDGKAWTGEAYDSPSESTVLGVGPSPSFIWAGIRPTKIRLSGYNSISVGPTSFSSWTGEPQWGDINLPNATSTIIELGTLTQDFTGFNLLNCNHLEKIEINVEPGQILT